MSRLRDMLMVAAFVAAAGSGGAAFAGTTVQTLGTPIFTVVGTDGLFTFDLTYTPDPGYKALDGFLTVTFDPGDGTNNTNMITTTFDPNSTFETSFEYPYTNPGSYSPSVSGFFNVSEMSLDGDFMSDGGSISASSFVEVFPGEVGPGPADGAPAPLAGAGLLSFFGAGGLAMRKKAKGKLAGLFSRHAKAA